MFMDIVGGKCGNKRTEKFGHEVFHVLPVLFPISFHNVCRGVCPFIKGCAEGWCATYPQGVENGGVKEKSFAEGMDKAVYNPRNRWEKGCEWWKTLRAHICFNSFSTVFPQSYAQLGESLALPGRRFRAETVQSFCRMPAGQAEIAYLRSRFNTIDYAKTDCGGFAPTGGGRFQGGAEAALGHGARQRALAAQCGQCVAYGGRFPP